MLPPSTRHDSESRRRIRNRDCGHSTKYDRICEFRSLTRSHPTLGADVWFGHARGALVPLVVLLAILAIDPWVYADARRWAAQGAPVVARIGSFEVETPETWFLGCLVLFILFFPLYMVSRAG